MMKKNIIQKYEDYIYEEKIIYNYIDGVPVFSIKGYQKLNNLFNYIENF